MGSNPEEAQKLHRFLVKQGAVSTCLNCCNWKRGRCALADTVPPAEVLVFGCPAWDNTLPF
jgi:hypothetical protein